VLGVREREAGTSERTFVCEECGAVLDRDLNASLLLASTVSSTGIYACGELAVCPPGRVAGARRGSRNRAG
jgi:transposase